MNIGLTQRVLVHNQQAYDSIDQAWYRYLKGHTLSFIPNRTDQNFEQLADILDCLIITGGDANATRVITELAIAEQMHLRSKPILGICHGSFMLQEVLGGSITDGNASKHYNNNHTVTYKNQEFTVNSFHTLSIRSLHKTGKILVTDNDGNIEAWIDNNIAGVVWHPERMIDPWLPDEIVEMIYGI